MRLSEAKKIVRLVQEGKSPIVKVKSGPYTGSQLPVARALTSYKWVASFNTIFYSSGGRYVEKTRIGLDLDGKRRYIPYEELELVDYTGKAATKTVIDPDFLARRAKYEAKKEAIRKKANPKDALLQPLAIGDMVFWGFIFEVIDIKNDEDIKLRELTTGQKKPREFRASPNEVLKLSKDMQATVLLKKLSGDLEKAFELYRNSYY
jgi:hypothetical protein